MATHHKRPGKPSGRGRRQPKNGCANCGKTMNPAERMLGPVCGECVRALHRQVVNPHDDI